MTQDGREEGKKRRDGGGQLSEKGVPRKGRDRKENKREGKSRERERNGVSDPQE